MSSAEKFCLRWNDFETNISVAFKELREEKDFFDVTLACEDSQLQAHKVILSACSPFFRNVLRRNPHQHPLLYLKGVKYTELLSVLNFMYMGEVNVAQDELNSFLSVAEDLKVKGLTQSNSTETPSSKSQPKQDQIKHVGRPREPPERDPILPPKRPRPLPPNPTSQMSEQSQSFHQDDDIQEVVPVKSEPRDPVSQQVDQQVYHQSQGQDIIDEHHQGTVALEDNYGDEGYDYGQYEEGYDDGTGMAMGGMGTDANKASIQMKVFQELEEIVGSLTCTNGPGSFSCFQCNYTTAVKTNLTGHIEANHLAGFGIRIPCKYFGCEHVSGTRNANRKHICRY